MLSGSMQSVILSPLLQPLLPAVNRTWRCGAGLTVPVVVELGSAWWKCILHPSKR